MITLFYVCARLKSCSVQDFFSKGKEQKGFDLKNVVFTFLHTGKRKGGKNAILYQDSSKAT